MVGPNAFHARFLVLQECYKEHGKLGSGKVIKENVKGLRLEPFPEGKVHWLKASPEGWAPEDPTDHVAQTLWQEPAVYERS